MSGLVVATLRPVRNRIIVPDEGVDFLERRRFDELRRELGGLLPVMGMAKIHPDEGLDYIHNTFLRKTVTPLDPLFLGLFTSQSNSTVPARTAVLATLTGVTEVTGGAYARASIAASNWPAPATSGSGRRSTVVSPGVSFPESTGAYSNPVNGFFLATTAGASSGVAIFYSNSETVEGTADAAVTVASAGYVIRVAPFEHFNG